MYLKRTDVRFKIKRHYKIHQPIIFFKKNASLSTLISGKIYFKARNVKLGHHVVIKGAVH